MDKKSFFVFIVILFFLSKAYAQSLEGRVFDADDPKQAGLPDALLFWLGSKEAVSTDPNGHFIINRIPSSERLVVSMMGYKSDTLETKGRSNMEIGLRNITLKEVTVSSGPVQRSMLSSFNMENIGLKEIKTAACCNLSEAFTQNSAVDVVYSDAVSGAKEIRMMGLDGYYTQVLIENQPAVRGLNQMFGLQYIPGQWMKGISVTKGSGSVVNGYDAITGQINVDYKKSLNSDIFSFNLFGTHQGYFELNSDFSYRLSDRLSTMAFVHGEGHPVRNDFNKDGFLDHPLYYNVNAMNRWRYDDQKNFETDIMGSFLQEQRRSGQVGRFKNPESGTYYGINIDTRRYDLFAKTGFYLPGNNSLGIQYRFFRHEVTAAFGNNNYGGLEHYGNVNLIYQVNVPDLDHSLKLGASYTFDKYDEGFNNTPYRRTEHVPGLFAEYTYKYLEKLTLVAGLRLDYNSAFNAAWVSPRLNLRYAPRQDFVIRVSAGKGYRSPNVYAENMSLFASNRIVLIEEKPGFESAWNYGIGLTKEFTLFQRKLSVSLDFYRTDFQHQLIADREYIHLVRFYNLEGKSFSNSFQAEANWEFLPRFHFKTSFKYDDVRQSFRGNLMRKPLVPVWKVLGNLNYTTKNEKWIFTLTAQVYGKARIPNTQGNPEELRLPAWSKPYFIMNAQINYHINKKWEIYAGAENMNNFMQQNAILDAQNPFGAYFDASLIYGPVDGVRAYVGMRYQLPYDKSKR